jgi:uncharacterized protein (DUF2147 family)
MMRVRLAIAAAAFVSSVWCMPAQSAGKWSPAGLWQAVDSDTKQPTGWFLISLKDGVYTGILAKMFLKPGEDPNAVCDQCKDDRLNHPWLGLEIIRGMKQEAEHPDRYSEGTILDPRDGKVYKAMLTVSPDGQTLTVRGYVGFSLLGKNVYWTRLPDSAMTMLDPAVNPNPAVNAVAPAVKAQPARKPPAAPAAAAPPLDGGLRR